MCAPSAGQLEKAAAFYFWQRGLLDALFLLFHFSSLMCQESDEEDKLQEALKENKALKGITRP
jgi:hypothetical protein